MLAPFDNRQGFIWYNGSFVAWTDATLHLLSHGLHYASCVFEGERVYDGVVFKLDEHTQRLHHSANLLGFSLPYDTPTLHEATAQLIKKQNIENGYVRPVAWRGSEMMAISAQQNRIHCAIAAWVWPSYFDPSLRKKGIRLQYATWHRPPSSCAPTSSKAAGLYMICTLSKHHAEKEGYDDALMLDHQGYIAEATGANIFFVIDDALHTPQPDCFLDGITRQCVIQLARNLDIPVFEKKLKPEDIKNAQAAFLTGTAVEITPIAEIDGLTLKGSPIIDRLIDAFNAYVADYCVHHKQKQAS